MCSGWMAFLMRQRCRRFSPPPATGVVEACALSFVCTGSAAVAVGAAVAVAGVALALPVPVRFTGATGFFGSAVVVFAVVCGFLRFTTACLRSGTRGKTLGSHNRRLTRRAAMRTGATVAVLRRQRIFTATLFICSGFCASAHYSDRPALPRAADRHDHRRLSLRRR